MGANTDEHNADRNSWPDHRAVLRLRPAVRPGQRTSAARLTRRDHKKTLTVDSVVGFTGGLNLADDYAAMEDGGAEFQIAIPLR